MADRSDDDGPRCCVLCGEESPGWDDALGGEPCFTCGLVHGGGDPVPLDEALADAHANGFMARHERSRPARVAICRFSEIGTANATRVMAGWA